MGYKPFDKEKSHYLLVGVGQRNVDSDAMAISAEDAKYLDSALEEFNIFNKNMFEPLVNEKATRAAILDHLDTLIEKTKNEPADMVLIFFSGHGYDKDDHYYLVCRDTLNNDIENTSIEGSDFVKKLTSIQCDKMLVLLDCCHAEGMTDVPFNSQDFLEQKNKVILTSCHKSQLSYLSRPVSLFTHAVIEGLGGKFLNEGDKDVSVFNLAMDVRERVVALSKKIKKIQQPQLNALPKGGTTDFALVRYPKGGPQEVTLLNKELNKLKSDDGKKDLQMDVVSETDVEEREKFQWMVNINVMKIKDSTIDRTVFVQAGPGSNVTVNQKNLQDGNKSLREKFENELWKSAKTWINSIPGSNDAKALEKDIRALNDTIEKLTKDNST